MRLYELSEQFVRSCRNGGVRRGARRDQRKERACAPMDFSWEFLERAIHREHAAHFKLILPPRSPDRVAVRFDEDSIEYAAPVTFPNAERRPTCAKPRSAQSTLSGSTSASCSISCNPPNAPTSSSTRVILGSEWICSNIRRNAKVELRPIKECSYPLPKGARKFQNITTREGVGRRTQIHAAKATGFDINIFSSLQFNKGVS